MMPLVVLGSLAEQRRLHPLAPKNEVFPSPTVLLASPSSLMAHSFTRLFLHVVSGFAIVHTTNKEKSDDSITGRPHNPRESEGFHEGVIFRLRQEVAGQRR